MEQRLSSSLALFLVSVRKRLNQRKISLQDFIAECKLRNKSKISIFQFAIIVQRINCGTSFFKARQLFSQIIPRGQHISLETFRSLFLKVSKIPLDDIELNLRKNQIKSNSKQTLQKKRIVKTEVDQLQETILRQRRYYSQIGFNRLVKFISTNNQRPEKIFNDCDLDKSGFIDRNEFNKFLVASEISQFKDKDVRRYLISDVLDKLRTQTISKSQFFQIFTFRHPQSSPTVNLSVRESINSPLKKLQSSRGKVMSYSVAMKEQKKPNLPTINRRGKKHKHRKSEEDYYSGSENNEENYGPNPYAMFMGKGNDKNKYKQFNNIPLPFQNPEFFEAQYAQQYYQFGLAEGNLQNYYQGDLQYQPQEGEILEDQLFEEQPIVPNQPITKPINQIKQVQPVQPKQPQKPVQLPKPVPAQPMQPIQPQKPVKPVQLPKPVQPVEPPKPFKPVQLPKPIQPVQPVQSNLFKRAKPFFRLGEPKQKDLQYLKQLETYLSRNQSFLDRENPKAKKEFTYKPASEIFFSMGLIEENGIYSLFSQSDESRNQNRKAQEFTKLIEADDIRQGEVGDCYYLSAIASIAFDYPQVLAEKFLFNANPANFYVTKLFIDGEWKYIKTDDKYPATQENTAYCHPRQAQIWVMLLQKSFAKVFGDYDKLDAGFQMESFFVLTGATSEYIAFEDNQNAQEVKKSIIDADKKGYLMCTSGGQKMSKFDANHLQKIGLVPGHAYSLLTVFFIGQQLVVKLRNPWGNSVYQGEWSFNSKKWTPQLRKQYNYQTNIENGDFFLSWQEYIKFYANVTICKIHPTFVHTSFRMINNKRKSNYVQVTVATKGTYHFFICQESSRKYEKTNFKYSYSDSRIILLKKNNNSTMQFVAAKFLGGNQQTQMNVIETQLEAGTYIISAKVNWTNGWNQHQCFLVSYGCQTVNFQLADRSIAPKFKLDMLTSYALLRSPKAQKKDYKDYGAQGVKGQNYFDIDEGIGYFKVMNRSKKNYKLTFDFALQQSIKVIKPNTINWKANVKVGQDAIIGFFIAGSYGYELTEYLE